jgi:hypothetical protein
MLCCKQTRVALLASHATQKALSKKTVGYVSLHMKIFASSLDVWLPIVIGGCKPAT